MALRYNGLHFKKHCIYLAFEMLDLSTISLENNHRVTWERLFEVLPSRMDKKASLSYNLTKYSCVDAGKSTLKIELERKISSEVNRRLELE